MFPPEAKQSLDPIALKHGHARQVSVPVVLFLQTFPLTKNKHPHPTDPNYQLNMHTRNGGKEIRYAIRNSKGRRRTGELFQNGEYNDPRTE